jgi:energy-coupling factor transporter ATP-binding protein EcfA2
MADQTRIASIRLIGVFEHQQLMADFRPGLNLLHGKNGSGKTTLLHVLANLLEGDLYRFCNIRFSRLIVRLYDDTEIVLEQPRTDDRVVVRVVLRGQDLGTLSRDTPVPEPIASSFRELFPARPVYLPAFRSILEAADDRERYSVYPETINTRTEFEAIKAHEERYSRLRPRGAGRVLDNPNATASKTVLCRRWFGDFVPIVRYPSLADVSRQLRDEFEQAYFTVNRNNQETFSTVFSEVLQAVLEKRAPQVGEDVKSLLTRVQTHLRALAPENPHGGDRYGQIAALIEKAGTLVHAEEQSIRAILEIYDSALAERAKREEEAYRGLRQFEQSFNRFIEPKELRVILPIARRRTGPMISFPNGYSAKLGVLSSGERQVLTMLFCATHMSPADGTMLIDEPEISLHVDWQRIILDEIIRQAGDRQIIACTHAPEVVAEHRDALVELSSKTWSSGEVHAIDIEGEGDSTGGDN